MEKAILKDIRSKSNKEKGQFLMRFFKTGKGQYGEGDIFAGLAVPMSRSIAKKYSGANLDTIDVLLKNKIHEARLIALLILVDQYKKANPALRKKIATFYISHATCINNWDLVDSSAHQILGEYLVDKDRKILLKLSKSKNLWERRISIVATYAFICRGEYEWTFKISENLMNDTHDLIHKASGWMLREVGKRSSMDMLYGFLDVHASYMPRTMLRYALERIPQQRRRIYMQMKQNMAG